MTSIVFSKDRALQLDAFLQSYRDNLVPLGYVHVFYKATSLRHEKAYQEVFSRHQFIVLHGQADFKQELIRTIPDTGTVIFFVDDQIFIRPWRVRKLPGLSLRLAPHLTRCYPLDAEQPVPKLTQEDLELLAWKWGEGKLDWGYPLSVDGHVFDAAECREMLQPLNFDTPNTLEMEMQRYILRFRSRLGYCYGESKVVNVPWNRVQNECPNRAGSQHSADEMLAMWERGERIDVAAFYGISNDSAHQEFPLMLVAR